MSHEKKPGMIKIAIRDFSSTEIDRIAKSANCTVEDVKFILNIIESHFKKKKYVDISVISTHTAFSIDKAKFIINSINAVSKTPNEEPLQRSQTLIFEKAKAPDKKRNNDTENPGPMVTAKDQTKGPKGRI
ncbi:hypothetical protein CC99x_007840 [Candidatus Berkiella cookevillensis]|uniref:Uncharacterized protein n=1 Tax=Candidatus Berkiella cookevillensis TaxID=437022 RepID=A0A0Q9Y8N0_9GAMM|nr:hypothetical protein [Candidatus Berkiella cookevillensis]MCS5708814.1 hypothetical protein [Candidatus Berkiella cookevillensis]